MGIISKSNMMVSVTRRGSNPVAINNLGSSGSSRTGTGKSLGYSAHPLTTRMLFVVEPVSIPLELGRCFGFCPRVAHGQIGSAADCIGEGERGDRPGV